MLITSRSLPGAPKQKLKSSVQRSLRQSLLTTYPLLNPYIDEVLPKKASLNQIKLPERASLYVADGEPIFFQHFDGPFYPTLRLLHKCMSPLARALPPVRPVVAQGLGYRGLDWYLRPSHRSIYPSEGTDRPRRYPLPPCRRAHDVPRHDEQGWLSPPPEEEIPAGAAVAIYAEGKEHAVGVGITKMSTEEIKKVNKNIGVETTTYLGDDLWSIRTL